MVIEARIVGLSDQDRADHLLLIIEKNLAETASGRIMRSGRRVAVVRMEMHNQDALLVAVGTGTYMVG